MCFCSLVLPSAVVFFFLFFFGGEGGGVVWGRGWCCGSLGLL